MKVNMTTQPHLGRRQENYKPHDAMGGHLSLAKVIEVHHKHGTVDVQLIKSGGLITSSEDNEGKYGVRVLGTTAHHNRELLNYSGTIEPIQKGQIVVVAFLDNSKQEPFILGSFHNTWKRENNMLTDKYPLRPEESIEDEKEAFKYLKIFPSQVYNRVDGIGGIETSHPSKSFSKIDTGFDSDIEIDDKHKGFDHKDLEEKNKHTGETLSSGTEISAMPLNMLSVHRSSHYDEDTTWTKFFIDPLGMFRVTRDNDDDKLTYMEFGNEGSFKVRRQIDSPLHGNGQDSSEISITEEGTLCMERISEGSSKVEIDTSGDIMIKHKSGSYISMTSDGDIIIKPARNVHIG